MGMKQLLLICAVVALVGCGQKEPVQKEPELRSENIITPDEAANELFVEAVMLVDEAKTNEDLDVEVAIKKYEEAFAKLQKIISDYKKSALAVKLISGETLFNGESLEQLKRRPTELAKRAAATRAAEALEQAAIVGDRVSSELNRLGLTPSGKLRGPELQRLEILNLSETEITDLGLKDVAKFQNLKMLFLGDTKISDTGLKEVAKLRNLILLYLKGSQITDAGLEEVAKMQQLLALNLSNTQITDAGLKEVAKLQQLGELNLSETRITDAGLVEVAKLKQLEILHLNDTQITDTGLKEVAKLQQLEMLHLNETKITDAGLKDVAKFQQLGYLDLYNTKVTKAGVAELKKALPNCEIKGP